MRLSINLVHLQSSQISMCWTAWLKVSNFWLLMFQQILSCFGFQFNQHPYMLPKDQRLTWRDIQYLLRRGRKYYGNVFVMTMVPQYPNKPVHQYAIQIPNKLDKRATMRNLLKRHAMHILEEHLEEADWPRLKAFFFINKQQIDSRRPPLATLWKTAIVEQRKHLCKKDFTALLLRLWASSNNGLQK